MKAQELLAQQFGMVYGAAAANLEGMTHADSLKAVGGGNCANWILGHLVNMHNGVMGLEGAEPVWEDEQCHWSDGGLALSFSPSRTAQLPRRRSRTAAGGDPVDEKALFTQFWTDESKTTRNVLARIPEGSDYRPDPKSRTAQEIAWQIVCEEKMIIDALENGEATWDPPPLPATMKEVLEAYEKQSPTLPERWEKLPQDRWGGELEFFGGKRPASPMAWSFLFDIVHHRGQITTYLRPMGSTVPQIYGPSADEP